ncbi:MAG: AsmA family protein [Steroidobacteraceae bacterium]
MEASWDARGWLKLTLRMLAFLVALLAVLGAAVLLFSNHLRGPVIRYLQTHSGRQLRVDGRFDVHLLSLHPRIDAERVTIGNPPWTSSGITAQIGHLSLTFDWSALALPRWGIRRLEMEQATLHLSRDENLRANWQVHDPANGLGSGPPLIRSLSMPNARVQLDDRRRHLRFDGIVSAGDLPGRSSPPALRIEGAGELNGRQANFSIDGEPLATAERDHPYRFEFREQSSGSQLSGKGVMPHPFNIQMLDATFDATGEDMKDLYFLTGLKLPDTGKYRLSGKFARLGLHMQFNDLEATSGRSDVRGTVLIDVRLSPPSHVEADLRSQLLRLSDLGQRAAGRAPKPVDKQRPLLPDTPFRLTGLRRSDAVVSFHAQVLEAGRVALHTVAAKVTLDRGTLVAAPVSASLRGGKITGELKFDSTRDLPAAEVDLRAANLKLGELAREHGQSQGEDPGGATRPPLVDGPLQGRVSLKGRGDSIHELASSANGRVIAVLPHGAVRSSLAELAGLDLRGLGLMAAGKKVDTGVRCGVASFDVQDGKLTAQSLVVDTDPVLVSGEGAVDLGSERLDLRFQGRPKHPRLRVRSALLVRGTLAHPSFSIDPKKPAAQAGGAIALGVLLTPVAAMLAFVDPGLAKDADCAALLAQAQTGGK